MLFTLIGLIIGTVGTLIGAGGGFVLVPLLIFMLPNHPSSRIAAISILGVGVNATSGSVAYAVKKQIHWKSAWIYSLAAIPGIFIGVYLNENIMRQNFILIFSLFIIFLSIYIYIKSLNSDLFLINDTFKFVLTQKIAIIGSFISIFIGVISSFLGIGGGIIHVPLLSTLLDYPVHIAAGTSHMILALTSSVAIIEHFNHGHYTNLESFVPYLLVGLVVGAQLGALLSKRVSSPKILKVLSIALLLGGIRLLVQKGY